jgi:DNA polymerase III delta' subunit
MRFDGFFGNEGTKAILSGLFDSRRIPHAILIDGPQGSGKKMLARILAAAAVCESGGELPCFVCRECCNALSDNHPDIVTIKGEGSRSFGVDTVRRLRLDAYVRPNDAARKVYILANVQDMTEQAQNALLKILEEPPAYVLFIFTCDSRSHLLETVRSRVQCVSTGPVTQTDAVKALTGQFSASDEEAARAARISGGIIGRAKLMLEEGFGEISGFFAEFSKALCSTDIYSFLSLSGRLEKDGGLFTIFLDMLPALMSDAVAVKTGASAKLSGCEEEAALFARSMTIEKLYRAQLCSLEARRAADSNVNLTLQLTALFSQLWRAVHS